MDRLEAELDGREYLVGDTFTVADLTAAALFFPIVRPDEAQYQMPEPLPEALVQRRGASRHARASSGCRRCTAATAVSPPKSPRSIAIHRPDVVADTLAASDRPRGAAVA